MLVILIILMLLGIIPCPFTVDGNTIDTSDTDIVFVSKSCSSCVQVKQTITRLQKANYDVILVDIRGTRYERALATKYHVYSVPTLIVRTNGIEINRKTGCLSEGTYRSLINKKNPYLTSNLYSGVLIFQSKKHNPDFISNRVIKNTKRNTSRYEVIYTESNDSRITQYNIQHNPTLVYLYLGKEMGRYTSTTGL